MARRRMRTYSLPLAASRAGLVGPEFAVDHKEVNAGLDGISDKPFQALSGVGEVAVFIDVYIAATGDLHAYSTPSKEHFVGPTLVNKNHSQQEDDSHDDVGEHQ